MTINPEGSLLLSAGVDGKIKIWDMTYIKYEKCIKEKLASYAYLIKPKDEFETTEQYNKRFNDFIILKSSLKEDCMRSDEEKKYLIKKGSYQFADLTIDYLGSYNADAQQHPVIIAKTNFTLNISSDDAKTLKTTWQTVKVKGIKRYNPDKELYEYINMKFTHPVSNVEYEIGLQVDPSDDPDLKAFLEKNKKPK